MVGPRDLRVLAAISVIACGPERSGSDAGLESGHTDTVTSDASGGSTPGSTASDSGSGTSSSSSSSSSSTAAEETSSTTGGPESACVPDPLEQFPPEFECDPYVQDCSRDEKCVPWANDGGLVYNAARCVPLPADPKEPGEPCTLVPPSASGTDDCDRGAICWWVDVRGAGVCVPMCSQGEGLCCELGSACAFCDDDCLPALCLRTCDPLAQDCPPFGAGEFSCIPDLDSQQFVCANIGEGAPSYGESCLGIGSCSVVMVCLAASVPACGGAECCTPFCDTTLPNACPDAVAGQECVPWYEPGMSPSGYENVGYCACPGGCP